MQSKIFGVTGNHRPAVVIGIGVVSSALLNDALGITTVFSGCYQYQKPTTLDFDLALSCLRRNRKFAKQDKPSPLYRGPVYCRCYYRLQPPFLQALTGPRKGLALAARQRFATDIYCIFYYIYYRVCGRKPRRVRKFQRFQHPIDCN